MALFARDGRAGVTKDEARADKELQRSCDAGAGHGCMRLADGLRRIEDARPSAQKTAAGVDAYVALYRRACYAPAPAPEACLEGGKVQRARDRFDEANELLRRACDLGAADPSCKPQP
jgi:TPR repeat protein